MLGNNKTYKTQNKYLVNKSIRDSVKEALDLNDRFLAEHLQDNITKNYGYNLPLSNNRNTIKNNRIFKKWIRKRDREFLKKQLRDELNYVEVDTVMVDWVTDAWYQDYRMFDHDNWLRYLGRTEWDLDDELGYDNNLYEDYEVEEYNFTDEEIEYVVNSWNKSNDKTELDPIQRAMNAYKGVKAWQDAWMKYGTVGAVKLYFNLDK